MTSTHIVDQIQLRYISKTLFLKGQAKNYKWDEGKDQDETSLKNLKAKMKYLKYKYLNENIFKI